MTALVETWLSLRDFGLKIHTEQSVVFRDSQNLHDKFHKAATNFAKATRYLSQLAEARGQLELKLPGEQGVARRQMEIELEEIDRLTVEHRCKRDQFLNLTIAIYRILRLNDAFLELLKELSSQIKTGLLASLEILRYRERNEKIPNYLWGEFRQAMGRLGHPARVYREIQAFQTG